MKLGRLFDFIHAKRIVGILPAEAEPGKVTQDTREVSEGDIFVCIEGSNFDGHSLADEAMAKGAGVIVAQKYLPSVEERGIPVVYVRDTRKVMSILAKAFYGNPSDILQMVGVTGTNGKTTVTHMVGAVCQSLGKKTGLIGTLGIRVGEERSTSLNTTPDSITLQRTLRTMVDKGVIVGALEVSSHALAQGRVWGIDFDVAVLTNITHEHLDFHHTMAEYAHTKEYLFSQLGTGWKQNRTKYAVLNKDDPSFSEFKMATSAQVISYSLQDPTADFYAAKIHKSSDGMAFDLVVNGDTYPVELGLIGEYNVANALAAFAACFALGFPLEKVSRSLKSLKGIDGRLEKIGNTSDYQVIVDYAHTPDGLEKVLHTIREVTPGRIILVMGCRGERDTAKRPIMGKIATEQSDQVFFTTDSPGKEPQSQIIGMLLSQVEKDNYEYIERRTDAIHHAVETAQTGDTVLITGRGHETTFQLGNQELHLVDSEVARAAVAKRQGKTPADTLESL